MDQFDKEADETHDGETNCCGDGNLLELLAVRFGASLHQPAEENQLGNHVLTERNQRQQLRK